MNKPIEGADDLIRTIERIDKVTFQKVRECHYKCGCVLLFKVTKDTPEYRTEEKLDNLLCPPHVKEYEKAMSVF